MIKFLVLQVKMGKITLEQVPERYREEVQKRLIEGFPSEIEKATETDYISALNKMGVEV